MREKKVKTLLDYLKKAHLKYLQDVARSYLCPRPSIFHISFRRALTQKVIDEMVIIYYILFVYT